MYWWMLLRTTCYWRERILRVLFQAPSITSQLTLGPTISALKEIPFAEVRHNDPAWVEALVTELAREYSTQCRNNHLLPLGLQTEAWIRQKYQEGQWDRVQATERALNGINT